MVLSLSINVDKLINDTSLEYVLYIYDITNTNVQFTGNTDTPLTGLEIERTNGHVTALCDFEEAGIQVTLTDLQLAQLYQDDGGSVVIDDHVITVTGNVDTDHSTDLIYLLQKGIIFFAGVTMSNLLFVYRMNSERNVVNKSLILVDIISGYFRSGVNIKNPTINIQNFKIVNTFNYVYIYALNRYYYVQNIELTTNKMTALVLAEDVLMSHKDLILNQYAYITRNENDYNAYLPDSRRAFYDKPVITYTEYDTGDYFNNRDVAGTSNDPVCYVLEVVRGD